MSKILITGGAGFIGSQLGFHLNGEGHEILLLDNMSYGRLDNLVVNGSTFGTFIGMDARSKDLYKIMNGVDYVFHFAGIAPLPDCQSRPYEAMDNNVSCTANVLDAARFNGVKRVIFSSTAAIYENNLAFPCEEDDEVSPYLLYSNSKLQAEMLCKSYSKVYGLDTVMLRFFNVYGPHQDVKRKHPPLMGYIIRELFYGRVPVLHSDGEQKRDYVYIQDVVNLCKLVMVKEGISSEIFNVCSGSAYSVSEIYQEIALNMGSDIRPIYTNPENFWNKYPELYQGKLALRRDVLAKEVTKYALGSNEKAKSIGWGLETRMKEGIEKSVKYALTLLKESKA